MQAIEFAWRAHTAQEGWTAKVDAKASLLLALEGGLLVAALAGHTKDGPLGSLHGWRNILQGGGVVLLLIAFGFAAGAVIPMLGRVRDHRASYDSNTIYFGHVRHWDPAALVDRLRTQTAAQQKDLLAQQLIQMSNRNWLKHRLVQASVFAVLPGSSLLSLAILWPH